MPKHGELLRFHCQLTSTMQTSHYYALCRQVSTTTYSTTTCRQVIEHDGNFYNIDITSGALRLSSTRKCSKMLLCLIQPLHCWCECMTNAEVTAGCRLALSIYSNASSFSKSFSSSLLSFFSGSCRSLHHFTNANLGQWLEIHPPWVEFYRNMYFEKINFC